jgi:hypothetical protein
MSDEKYKDTDAFSDEYVRKNRTFPRANAIVLAICVIAQVLLILFSVFYMPKPQDVINEYNITVEPLSNGSLDITYSFVWTAIDESEELTWVDIGMATADFDIYNKSLSDTIKTASKYTNGEYISTRIYFKRGYKGGETVKFSFTVNQKGLLHKNSDGHYYSFVPGWFNRIPVEKYKFMWEKGDVAVSNSNRSEGKYLVWEGKMDPGTYVTMNVSYDGYAFTHANASPYHPFNAAGVYNGLKEDKDGIIVYMVFVVIIIGIAELYIADSFVSYHRGRGFMTGYGHHVHLYGRSNPRYIRARSSHNAIHGSSFRGGGGRGCACACACACAGGGRAGCSQKDTYKNKDSVISNE